MNIKQFLSGVLAGQKKANYLLALERKISRKLFSFKRQLFKTALELFLFLFALITLAVGLILLLTRFFPLDIILLIIGILVLYILLIIVKFK